jgi:hypothetical protein
MPQTYMEANSSCPALYGYLLPEWYSSIATSGTIGDFDKTDVDTCDFGDACDIQVVEDAVGTFATNILSDLIKRLNEIYILPDNWDDQGTAAPNKLAYFHAREVIGVLSDINFVPAKLMPSAEEGIGFFFSNKNRYGFLECYNEGEIVVAMSNRNGYRKVWQIRDVIEEIKDALETLIDFLDAA